MSKTHLPSLGARSRRLLARLFGAGLILVLGSCASLPGDDLPASAVEVDLQDPGTLSRLASRISGSRVILVGEEHGVVSNQQIEAALFEELVRRHGVRVYLAESSYSFAAFVQHYLETGDEELLAQLMGRVRGTNAGVVEHRDFLRGLHRLHQSLPEEKRFRYIGIDVEHMDGVALSYLRWKLREAGNRPATGELSGTGDAAEPRRGEAAPAPPAPRPRPPEPARALKGRLETLLSDESVDDRGLEKSAELVRGELDRHPEAAEKLLGPDEAGVRNVTENILAKYRRNAAATQRERQQLREAAIYRTFRQVDAGLRNAAGPSTPSARYFGQWGAAHVFERPSEGVDWFASRLEPEEVSSTLLVYQNCRVLERKPYREERLNTWGLLGVSGRTLRAFASDIVLFPSDDLPPGDDRLVDAYLLVRNSTANTPYEPDTL